MHTFIPTLQWLWEHPRHLSQAAFLMFIGVMLAATVPAYIARKHPRLAVMMMSTGIVFFIGIIAWPTGRPLPAIDYGVYDVVQMKNNGGALFLVANARAPESRAQFWLLFEERGNLGWDLPLGDSSSGYVDQEYRELTVCVGETPVYRFYITDCTDRSSQ